MTSQETEQQATDECDLTSIAADIDVIDLQLLAVCRAEPLPKSQIVERASVGLNEKSVYHRITQLANQDLLQSQVCDGARFEMERQLVVAYEPSPAGERLLERTQVCQCDSCEAIATPSEHRHEWVDPCEYFPTDVGA